MKPRLLDLFCKAAFDRVIDSHVKWRKKEVAETREQVLAEVGGALKKFCEDRIADSDAARRTDAASNEEYDIGSGEVHAYQQVYAELQRLDEKQPDTASEAPRCGGTREVGLPGNPNDVVPCPGCPDCCTHKDETTKEKR